MVICSVCKGKGYIKKWVVTEVGKESERVKIWCEVCKGQGHYSFEGERTGVGWERE